jgi:hypothetical protein
MQLTSPEFKQLVTAADAVKRGEVEYATID